MVAVIVMMVIASIGVVGGRVGVVIVRMRGVSVMIVRSAAVVELAVISVSALFVVSVVVSGGVSIREFRVG